MKPKTLTPEVWRKVDAYLKQRLKDKLLEHKQYIEQHGEDMPQIRNWKWSTPR